MDTAWTSPNMMTNTVDTPPATDIAKLLSRLARHSLYCVAGFPLALAGFIAVVTGLSVGFGTLVLFVGVVVIGATLAVARGLAFVERTAAARAVDIDVPDTIGYKRSEPDDQPIKQMFRPLTDGQLWLDALHALVILPVSVVVFALAVGWWGAAVGGTTWPLWGWLVDTGDGAINDLPSRLGLGDWYLVRAAFYSCIGLVAAVTLPWGIAGLARIRAAVTELLLIVPSRTQSEVDVLTAGRDAARFAEETSMRRLERDIHDGPQQRLVRLSMDLGRAEMKAADGDPELSRAIGEAKRQTTETLEELRALSRGIAPPILVDRGLEAALEELAVRSTIPTQCVADLPPDRMASHVETAAYFVASEALTNAMKHSEADQVRIWVDTHRGRYGEMLRVQVVDDGVGGADLSKGHGLAGLAQRMQSVDGRLDVDSPPGGPTTVTGEIPCG
jgi:signal transduction histidine kinase